MYSIFTNRLNKIQQRVGYFMDTQWSPSPTALTGDISSSSQCGRTSELDTQWNSKCAVND